MLQITLFGSPHFTWDSKPVSGFVSNKARALLIYLAATGRAHSRDALAELLWADTPRSKRKNLKKVLSNLRHLEGIHLIEESNQLVALNRQQSRVDVCEFELLAKSASSTNDFEGLERAVSLYQADFLSGFNFSLSYEFEAWALGVQTRLKEQMVDLLRQLSADYGQRHDRTQAIRLTRRLLELEPWREESHRQLMKLLAQDGQRSTALAHFAVCKEILAQELGVEPDDQTKALCQELQNQMALTDASPSAQFNSSFDHVAGEVEIAESCPSNLLLHLSSFIGREQEIDAISRLLVNRLYKDDDSPHPSPLENGPRARLVTLTGVGGCGKTRLAIEAARNLSRDKHVSFALYADGVWIVEFAPLSNSEQVPQVVASVFNLREFPERTVIDTLIQVLHTKHLLLLLDNCEHLLEAIARLTQSLLQSCPGLTILATSRAPLGVPGEVVFPVPALRILNGGGHISVADLAQCEAVRLFCDRAVAAMPHFALTKQNADTVARICQQLDGIPLAIELAAARMRTLTPHQIKSRLADAFPFLRSNSHTSPTHHHSLQATLDWSYTLLERPEQVLFRRLAVFAGGWTLEMAEQVVSDTMITSPEIFGLHERVFEKSLIVRVDDGQGEQARYRLLEPVRQYAAHKLGEANETQRLRSSHLDWCTSLAEQAEEAMLGPDQSTWFDRLERELPNIREALDWSLRERALVRGFRLAGALWPFWEMHSHFSEGRNWLDRLLKNADPTTTIEPEIRMKVVFASAVLCWQQDLYAKAREQFEDAIGMAREIGADWFFAYGLCRLGRVLRIQGEAEEAQQCFETSLAMFHQLENTWAISRPLRDLGMLALDDECYDDASLYLERALNMRRAANDPDGIADALNILGTVERLQGNLDLAEAHYREALGYYQVLGQRQGFAVIQKHLGHVALQRNHLPQSHQYFRESLSLSHAIGTRKDVADALIGLQSVAVALGEWEDVASLERLLAMLVPDLAKVVSPEYWTLHEQALETAAAAVGEDRVAKFEQQGQVITVEQMLNH